MPPRPPVPEKAKIRIPESYPLRHGAGSGKLGTVMTHSREINCTACGQTALTRTEPVYEDFKKTGEEVICTACGHRYTDMAAVPFTAAASKPQVFTEADKPYELDIFSDDERRKCCAWCAHFVVNPFNQRCGRTNREVEATDLCLAFEPQADADEEQEKETKQ